MAASAALTVVWQCLGELYSSNKYFVHVKNDHRLRFIEQKLNVFEYFLRKSTITSRDSKMLEDLEGTIRDPLYKAQDLLEDFLFYNAAQSEGGINIFIEKHFVHHNLEQLLEEIHSIMAQAAKMLEKFAENDSELTHLQSTRIESTFPYAQVHSAGIYVQTFPEAIDAVHTTRINHKKEQKIEVLGLENDLLKIKDQLTGRPSSLQIVAIVGMGGIGKTTLAKAVFNDHLIQYHFYIQAWVAVSEVFNLKDLLLSLLQTVVHVDDEMPKMSKEKLSEKLYRHLKGQRFLIVLDDMWTAEAWDLLTRCCPDDNSGSRILLTTRLKSLADRVSSNSPHQMKLLRKDPSWKLLRYRVLLGRNCPPDMEDIGMKIAKQCHGLPLAIIVIAGVLSNMSQTRNCWQNVAERMSSLLTYGSERCLEVLALSYHYLPQRLKPCFLYFSAFPRDCEIECSRLIKLWIAEGFAEEEFYGSLEDAAQKYLEDLICRSLVLVGKRSSTGKIKTCCIHDLFLDFCLREARKENFLQVISSQGQVSTESNSILRRLSFHSGSGRNFLSESSIQLTRSILCFEVPSVIIQDIHLLLSNFKLKLLRVLDIGFVRFDYFPLAVLKLIHLRFLALTLACEIPPNISELRNLQTLIVHGPWIIKKDGKSPALPMEIWNMSKLRHLILTAACYLPAPFRGEDHGNISLVLQNLQELSMIRLSCCTSEMFSNLPSLKRLGICQIKEDLETYNGLSEFPNNLHRLLDLENLKCVFYARRRETMRLPHWNTFPVKLKKLTLSWSHLPWEDMAILRMLPNLEALKLKNYAFRGQVWNSDDGGFPNLRLLLIEKTDLVHWEAYRFNFPRLQRLILKHCESLEEIPSEIADDLQLIQLHDCSSSAEMSAREIQEEQRNRDNDGLVVRLLSKCTMVNAEPEDS